MLHYLLRRLGYSLLVLWGVATLVFFLFNVLPGDPARPQTVPRSDRSSLQEAHKTQRQGRSILTRYGLYLNELSPIGATYTNRHAIAPDGLHITRFGDSSYLSLKQPYLGRSYSTQRAVSAVLGTGLPGTLVLALSALAIAMLIGFGLGIIAALKKGTAFDTGAIAAWVSGISIPAFLAALVIAYIFGSLLSNYTGMGMTGSLFEEQSGGGRRPALLNLILPAIALSIRPMAIIIQQTRSAVIDALSQDYIRTAYAKGLRKSRVVLRHALPNALSPILTAIPGWLPELLAGSLFVEYIFGWKGIGKITVDALEQLDLPLVTGSVLLMALIFISVKLLIEMLYGLLDPRARR